MQKRKHKGKKRQGRIAEMGISDKTRLRGAAASTPPLKTLRSDYHDAGNAIRRSARKVCEHEDSWHWLRPGPGFVADILYGVRGQVKTDGCTGTVLV